MTARLFPWKLKRHRPPDKVQRFFTRTARNSGIDDENIRTSYNVNNVFCQARYVATRYCSTTLDLGVCRLTHNTVPQDSSAFTHTQKNVGFLSPTDTSYICIIGDRTPLKNCRSCRVPPTRYPPHHPPTLPHVPVYGACKCAIKPIPHRLCGVSGATCNVHRSTYNANCTGAKRTAYNVQRILHTCSAQRATAHRTTYSMQTNVCVFEDVYRECGQETRG